MRMVIINKRPYAIGLRWTTHKSRQDMKRARSDLFKEAQELNPDYDMIVSRQSQYAFGASGGRMQDFAKASSLAASLKSLLQTGDAFVGMFMLQTVEGDTVWWVIAFKDALVTALSDNVCTSREEAERQSRELKELLESVRQSVTTETVQDSLGWLTPMLTGGLFVSNRMESLTSLPSRRNVQMGLAGGLLLAGLAWYGVASYLEYQEARLGMENARLAMQSKEARRKELLAHPERHFPMPWQTAPEAQGFSSACLPVMLTLPLADNGWELASATCGGTSVRIFWAHKPGADYLNLPSGARLGKSPTQAVSTRPVTALPPLRRKVSHTNLLNRDEASRHLYQITQNTGSRLKLAFAAPQKTVVDKVEIVAPWSVGTWELSDVPDSLITEPALMDTLNLPGLVVTAMGFNTSWSLKGNVYVTENK